ncbi:MAG TPA: glycosyltransferase family 2 protein [Patescibacteria group bacterium]|nr:glycosyltransferase family 2 protein [Patescibacteria group bacterium]
MISVIIPTYNEKEVLEKCIESLGYQTEKDFEIIVIDDGSRDGTDEILINLKKTISIFHFFKQNHKGAGAARNFGVKNSKGEILVFVDADMTFDKNFLRALIKPIKDGDIKGTFSKEEYVSNWENNWAKCWNINENWENKRRHVKNYPDTQPVFRAILKSEFERVNGFTPGGYDDDWSLSQKLGYEAINAPDAIFYHKNPSNLIEIFKHAKWVGKRKYKLGSLGYIVALVRSSLPVSILIGIYKAILSNVYSFVVFKVVYDLGISIGILEVLFGGKSSK